MAGNQQVEQDAAPDVCFSVVVTADADQHAVLERVRRWTESRTEDLPFDSSQLSASDWTQLQFISRGSMTVAVECILRMRIMRF
jgi:hypothetical protein